MDLLGYEYISTDIHCVPRVSMDLNGYQCNCIKTIEFNVYLHMVISLFSDFPM